MTIDDYMDAARARHGLNSDRQLARQIGLSAPSVNSWRTKRAWPDDETMVRLADLAGIDLERALTDLNHWRAGPKARPIYERILARLTAALIVLGVAIPSPASAMPSQEQHYATI